MGSIFTDNPAISVVCVVAMAAQKAGSSSAVSLGAVQCVGHSALPLICDNRHKGSYTPIVRHFASITFRALDIQRCTAEVSAECGARYLFRANPFHIASHVARGDSASLAVATEWLSHVGTVAFTVEAEATVVAGVQVR